MYFTRVQFFPLLYSVNCLLYFVVDRHRWSVSTTLAATTDALPSVLWYCWLGLLTCKNRLPYNLYCVGGDVKHCSLTHSQQLTLQLSNTFKAIFVSQCAMLLHYAY